MGDRGAGGQGQGQWEGTEGQGDRESGDRGIGGQGQGQPDREGGREIENV